MSIRGQHIALPHYPYKVTLYHVTLATNQIQSLYNPVVYKLRDLNVTAFSLNIMRDWMYITCNKGMII